MKKMIILKAIFCLILILNLAYSADSLLDKKKDCKCRLKVNERVVGGKIAEPTSYRWVVSLFKSNFKYPNFIKKYMDITSKMKYFSCGGTLLNHRWVMTAAHCIPDLHRRRAYLKVGTGYKDLVKMFDLKNNFVKRIIVHPDFGNDNETEYLINDVALLELERDVEFSDLVGPACLGTVDRRPYKGHMTIVGFGGQDPAPNNNITKEKGFNNISRYLKENYLEDKSLSMKACKKYDSIICADNFDYEASSCYGDSGTSFHATLNGKIYVVGLVSGTDQFEQIEDWKFLCTGPTYYMRINKYLDFIEQYVGKDYCGEGS